MDAIDTGHQNSLKIVVFCLSPLGDALFATPGVRAIREKFPQAHILIVATPVAARILKSNPFQIQVLTIKKQLEFFPLLAAIRKYHYDLAVGFSPLGSFLVRFCNTPLRADLSMIRADDGLSVVDACLAVLKIIGIHSTSATTEFWISPKEKIQLEASVNRFIEKGGRHLKAGYIAVHSGGHYFVRKRWPVANFIELIQQLSFEGNYQVVLIGGTEDLPEAQMIQAKVPGVLNAVGKLKLVETAVLLSRCHLMIGNDSGPLHLGAAVGTPTIGLFGPTSPRQFYPYFPPDHVYCYQNLPCSPCYRYRGNPWQYLPRCAQAYCMEAITPAEVFYLAQQRLNATNRPLQEESPPLEALPPLEEFPSQEGSPSLRALPLQKTLPPQETYEVKEWR